MEKEITDKEIREAIELLKSAKTSGEGKFIAYCETHGIVHLIGEGCLPYFHGKEPNRTDTKTTPR